MLEQYPSRAHHLTWKADALVMLNRRQELGEFVADAFDERLHQGNTAIRAPMWLAHAGDFEDADKICKVLLEDSPEDWGMNNHWAWRELFKENPSLEKAVVQGEKAVQKSGGAFESLHTLASIRASQGKNREVLQLLMRSVETRSRRAIHHSDWYVLGRMAEEYELPDVAIDCYKRVERGNSLMMLPTHDLARGRLVALEQD